MAENLANVEIKVKFSLNDVILAVRELGPDEREDFIESLLAATSPEYQKSIREARADYKAGRVQSHEQVFGKAAKK